MKELVEVESSIRIPYGLEELEVQPAVKNQEN
jgi:hypothetical protein